MSVDIAPEVVALTHAECADLIRYDPAAIRAAENRWLLGELLAGLVMLGLALYSVVRVLT